MPSEIGTQYILLLLVEMQESHLLRLPYRAKEIVPPEVAVLLPALQQPGFPVIETVPARMRSKRMQDDKSKENSPQKKLFQDL